MFISPRPRFRTALALGLALAMTSPPVGGLLSAAQAQGGRVAAASGSTSILFFPFVNNAGDAAASVASRLSDAIKLRVDTVGSYTVTSYTSRLPQVQRAIGDNVLGNDDIAPPFTDAQKADKVAVQVASDDFLLGAVESYNADPATKKVTIEASASLYNTATGAAIRTVAFTGTAVPTSKSDDMDTVTQEAINDVASKIAAAINGGATRPPAVVAESQRGTSRASRTALLAVLGGALLYAVLHNSSHSTSGSSNTSTSVGGGGGNGGDNGGPPAPP